MGRIPHTASQNVGYQGCRIDCEKPVVSLKPGENQESRDRKFDNVSRGVAYNKPLPKELALKISSSAETYAVVKRGDYKIPDKRGVCFVSGEDPTARSKPFLHKTLYTETFRNYKNDLDSLAHRVPEEYRAAFNTLAHKGVDVPYITGGDLLALARAVHGGEVQRWVVDRMAKLFQKRGDGKITWSDLEAGVLELNGNLQKEIANRSISGPPEWATSLRHMDATVQHGKRVQSCYQSDLGTFGTSPMQRQLTYKNGMLGTTQDLFEGTTKDTYHVPGYCGFIPSKVNPYAFKHGDMEHPREKMSNLRLVHRKNVPGYTGHCPKAAVNDIGEMACGRSHLTTSGAAALGLALL